MNAVTIYNRVVELFPDSDAARKASQWLASYDEGAME